MQGTKKSKQQKSPAHEIHLYKSTHLKQPFHIKNRSMMISSNNDHHNNSKCKSNSKSKCNSKSNSKSNSVCISNSCVDGRNMQIVSGVKSIYLGDGCGRGRENEDVRSLRKKMTQHTRDQDSTSQNKIQQLLGIQQNSKKASTIRNRVLCQQQQLEQEQAIQLQIQISIERLRNQNKELMKTNQLLLYEKQYYKQKTIMQEVEIREWKRKFQELDGFIRQKKQHHKNKSQSQNSSQLTFKLQAQNCLRNRKQESNWSNYFYSNSNVENSNIHQNQDKDMGHRQLKTTKQHKIINLAQVTEKSSLLMSDSEDDRHDDRPVLRDLENMMYGAIQDRSHVVKTEKEFSELLESVQNQSNINRKTTLRKMLAIKAMELKKVKQKP